MYYSDHVYVNRYGTSTGEALLIGYCFDTRNAQKSQHEVVEMLLSSSTLIDELEYINGRYILLINRESGIFIYSDASQLQPLCYHGPTGTFASHDRLLAESLGENGISVSKRPGSLHTELDFTRFEEIFKVNPSLEIKVDDMSFRRIYPRTQLERVSVEETFEASRPYLEESRKWIRERGQDIFLTLTAGIDSRVSASLTRDFHESVEYLTYFTPRKFLATPMAKEIHRIDQSIAEQMKNNMGWNHSIVNLSDYKPDKQVASILEERFNSRHAYGLINYYRDEKGYKHALHIKSTVFGMGKADFKKSLDQSEETLDFYKKCVHGLPKNFEKNYDVEHEIENYFKRNLVEANVTKGRHYFDLFHLESRMGNWHSTLTLETDPEVDEFIFMNTRKMIDLMQQPGLRERRNFEFYKTIINHFWPVLLHFGINQEKNAYERARDKGMDDQRSIAIEGLVIHTDESMEIKHSEGNKYHIRPGDNRTKAENINYFTMRSSNEMPVKVSVKGLYSNPKGKGIIKVIIRSVDTHDVYDMTSLNEPLMLEVGPSSYTVMVLYNRDYDKKSWQEAGKLEIERL
ncbi:hypothetical protein FO441_00910 [Salinicoccus cyprini]|uniref:Asparagine synthetase domain-containing protein n=1 Tax=Salinicoccus cyprini TaxID=2493691 RepID=A0A558AX96_9STAP|nr:hypothetical protein [Salinicoccus cyprini]TVT28871.1 hypothetical protein FO441_00910 [Salinicoccus cyprini]